MWKQTLILSMICFGALSENTAYTATIGAYPDSSSSVKGTVTVV